MPSITPEDVEALMERNPVMVFVLGPTELFGELMTFAHMLADERNSTEADWIDVITAIEKLELINTDYL